MNATERLGKIILSMREYQKNNNIKGECITNAQYLYDTIKFNFKNAKIEAKAIIAAGQDDECKTCNLVCGHIVIFLNDNIIIDPSYETYSLPNKRYFLTIKELMENTDEKNKKYLKSNCKDYLKNHCDLIKIADKINNGGILIYDKKFYNDQADYVEQMNKI